MNDGSSSPVSNGGQLTGCPYQLVANPALAAGRTPRLVLRSNASPVPPAPASAPPSGPDMKGASSAALSPDEVVAFLAAAGTAVSDARSIGQLLKRLADELSRFCGVNGFWVAASANPGESQSPSTGPEQPHTRQPLRFVPVLDSDGNPLWPLVGAEAQRLAGRCFATGRPEIAEIPGCGRLTCQPIAAPGRAADEFSLILFPARLRPEIALLIGSHLAATVATWRSGRLVELSSDQVQSTGRLLGALRAVSQADSAAGAAVVAVNQAQHLLRATQVIAVRTPPSGRPQVLAVSGVESFDPASPLLEAATAACRAIQPGADPVFCQPASGDSADAGGKGEPGPLDALARHPGWSACFHVQKEMPGGERIDLLAGVADALPGGAQQQQALSHAALLLAHELGMVRAGYEPAWTRTIRLLRNLSRRKVIRYALIAAAAIAGILLVPVPWRVPCTARLEPVERRYVSAPFEGTLERTLVRNGDTVRSGDLLAVLDGRPLRMEHSALEAEVAAARKRRDAALASGNIADAQVAKNDSLRAEAKLELVTRRLGELEIRSPVDGVVVSGDLETAEGATLRIGQTMFEIGPLDRIRAEVHVPEGEVRHVQAGAMVRVRLESWPFDSWWGTVERLHPRSEMADDRNCFVAEVALDNGDGRLRPGMKGRAGISAGWRPLGWIWMHRAWERVRYLLV